MSDHLGEDQRPYQPAPDAAAKGERAASVRAPTDPAGEEGAGAAAPFRGEPSGWGKTEPEGSEPDGERIGQLRDSVNEAGRHARTVYVTYLLFGLYLAIIIGGTTHLQLLLESPITLPLLNVGLPLVAFYWIAPFLFLLLHLNLLVQLYLLSRKLVRFDEVVTKVGNEASQAELRSQLYPFPFVQLQSGGHRERLPRFFLWLMVWLTIGLAPTILLLGVQVRFLPYHDALTTTWHRVLVVAEALLILFFWHRIRHPSDTRPRKPRRWLWHQIKAVAGGLLTIGISLILFTFPGDGGAWKPVIAGPQPEGVSSRFLVRTNPGWRQVWNDWFALGDPMEEWLHGTLPASWFTSVEYDPPVAVGQSAVGDDIAEKRLALIPTSALFDDAAFLDRNLRVFEQDLITNWPTQAEIDQYEEDGAWERFGTRLTLRGRDLRFADLDRSTLPRANLLSANLQGADLSEANLQDAILLDVNFRGANLSSANLQGALLRFANLQGAALRRANLQGADLGSANLQGAYLADADLGGASLSVANLQGAYLADADLEGAFLSGANLQGADLGHANLQGADLRGANLQGADLRGPNLQGATLWEARLWHARGLEEADWSLSDLRSIDLGPPTTDAISAWRKEAETIVVDDVRAHVLSYYQEFETQISEPWKPKFGDRIEGRALFAPEFIVPLLGVKPPSSRRIASAFSAGILTSRGPSLRRR